MLFRQSGVKEVARLRCEVGRGEQGRNEAALAAFALDAKGGVVRRKVACGLEPRVQEFSLVGVLAGEAGHTRGVSVALGREGDHLEARGGQARKHGLVPVEEVTPNPGTLPEWHFCILPAAQQAPYEKVLKATHGSRKPSSQQPPARDGNDGHGGFVAVRGGLERGEAAALKAPNSLAPRMADAHAAVAPSQHSGLGKAAKLMHSCCAAA